MNQAGDEKEFTDLHLGKKQKYKRVIKKKIEKKSTRIFQLNIIWKFETATWRFPNVKIVDSFPSTWHFTSKMHYGSNTLFLEFHRKQRRAVLWRLAPQNPHRSRKDQACLSQDLDTELRNKPKWPKLNIILRFAIAACSLLWCLLSEITWLTELRILYRGQEWDQFQNRSVHCHCADSRQGEYF